MFTNLHKTMYLLPIMFILFAALALAVVTTVQTVQAGTDEYCLFEYQWDPGCPFTLGCGPQYNWQSQGGSVRECCYLYGQWVCDPWQPTARCGCGD